jgi:hypothetical protein
LGALDWGGENPYSLQSQTDLAMALEVQLVIRMTLAKIALTRRGPVGQRQLSCRASFFSYAVSEISSYFTLSLRESQTFNGTSRLRRWAKKVL